MAEPAQKPPGYSPRKWDAQMIAQGQKISTWAIMFAEEVSFQNADKESPEYVKLANDFYTNLEMVSRGERLLGNPSSDPAYKDKLPLGGNPNPLEDMHAWLYEHADELNMSPEFIARMSMSSDDRSFYNLLNTRTPTTNADLTESQKDIAFPLGMEGEVGFKTPEEFLVKYFKVPEAQLAALGTEPSLDELEEMVTPTGKKRGGGTAIGDLTATPKQALGVLASLDIKDMEGKVPDKMGMPAKNAKGEPTTERANIERIIKLATSLDGKIGERDGVLVIQASTPEELAKIESDARELEKLAGASKALHAYSPNFIAFESFKNDPNGPEPGAIYSHTSVVAGIETIERAARAKGAAGLTMPPAQSPAEFAKGHPDVPTGALDKGAAMLDELRRLSENPALNPEDRAFFRETLQQLQGAGPQIFTIPGAGKPEAPKPPTEKRSDLQDPDGRHAAFTSSLAGVYLDLKGVQHSTIAMDDSPRQQRDLPQVMVENTLAKKSTTYLA